MVMNNNLSIILPVLSTVIAVNLDANQDQVHAGSPQLKSLMEEKFQIILQK